MGTLRLVVAAVALLVGLLWIGQGVGIVGGSAMTGSSFWAVAGVVLVLVAAGIAVLGRRTARG